MAKKEYKIITYIGLERCDLLYYLVKLGRLAGKHILVIDNSFSGDYAAIYTKEESDMVEYENVTIARGYALTEQVASQYDFVFLYYGRNLKGLSVNADYYVLAENQEYLPMEHLKAALESSRFESSPYLIVRDKVNNKLNNKTYAEMLGIHPYMTYDLYLEPSEYQIYMNIARDGRAKVKHLDEQTENMLIDLSIQWYDVSQKVAKDNLRKMKKEAAA